MCHYEWHISSSVLPARAEPSPTRWFGDGIDPYPGIGISDTNRIGYLGTLFASSLRQVINVSVHYSCTVTKCISFSVQVFFWSQFYYSTVSLAQVRPTRGACMWCSEVRWGIVHYLEVFRERFINHQHWFDKLCFSSSPAPMPICFITLLQHVRGKSALYCQINVCMKCPISL